MFCKSFHKVDLVVLIASNSVDHHKWSIVRLNWPNLYYSTKTCGYYPHLILLSIWKVSRSPYLVSRCYECFIVFILSCMQLDHNIIWRKNWWNKLKFYWFLIHPSPLSNLAYLIFPTRSTKNVEQNTQRKIQNKKYTHECMKTQGIHKMYPWIYA